MCTPQARSLIERKQYGVAESIFLKAKRPEAALKMYRDAKLWHDALRVAENYLPAKARSARLASWLTLCVTVREQEDSTL